MAKLRDIARVVRGKNAGALYLTLDVMFDDDATYRRVHGRLRRPAARAADAA